MIILAWGNCSTKKLSWNGIDDDVRYPALKDLYPAIRSLRRLLAEYLKAGIEPSKEGANSVKSLMILGSLNDRKAVELSENPTFLSVRFISAKIFMNFEFAVS